MIGAGRTRVLGLTGSVGMGKTTAAAMLERMGVPVFAADAYVHHLLGQGGALATEIEHTFPGTTKGGIVARAKLAKAVFGDQVALSRLEAILHPRVRAAEMAFIRRQNLIRTKLCVLEIPLLFETQAERLCDAVTVLTAPAFVQETRVMARPGMTRVRLEVMRARQMTEVEKAARADFLIATGLGRRHTWRALRAIVRTLTG
ncbi:MAG: dephospho-CoA kinase [Alphaproteobacteria bacterium]